MQLSKKMNVIKEEVIVICRSYDFVPGQCKGNNGKHIPNDKIIQRGGW